jgi:hypothetical protein
MIHKLIVIAFLFVILAVWWFGLYPLATVNLNPVFKRDFDARVAEASLSLKTVGEEDLNAGDLELRVLDAMVKEKIAEELTKQKLETKYDEIRAAVQQKVSSALESSEKYQEVKKDTDAILGANEKLQQTGENVTNMRSVTFFSELSSQMGMSGDQFKTWMFDNVSILRIYVFWPAYTWDKESFSIVKE